MFPICINCYNQKTIYQRLIIHKISKRKCLICKNSGDFLCSEARRECDHPEGCDYFMSVKFNCNISPKICIHRRLE